MTASIKTTVVKSLSHNGEAWQIVLIKGSYYARYLNPVSDTGPFSTVEQAVDFITSVKKV